MQASISFYIEAIFIGPFLAGLFSQGPFVLSGLFLGYVIVLRFVMIENLTQTVQGSTSEEYKREKYK